MGNSREADGGCVTDALVVNEKSGNDGELEGNPENDSFDLWKQWKELAETVLGDGLKDVFPCLLANIKKGHLPSLKLLMYLVELPDRKRPIGEREQLSLARVLWNEFNVLKMKRLALEGVVVVQTVEDLDAGGGGGGQDSE